MKRNSGILLLKFIDPDINSYAVPNLCILNAKVDYMKSNNYYQKHF